MNIRGGWLTIIQVDGINGPVDFNVFNGTVVELQAFVDGIKETP